MSNPSSSAHTFQRAPSYWEKKGLVALLFWPISKLFGFVSQFRRCLYGLGLLKSNALNVPVIIVGNLRVGGTGKTPTVLAIAKKLCEEGFHPGIISRGYKGAYSENELGLSAPLEVTQVSDPLKMGDEPCYMAQQLAKLNIQVPIFIHHLRTTSAKALLKAHPDVDVLISDDGLQHYAMKRWPAREGGRDIELVIRDARGEGNGFLLPAGPLRESSHRARDYTLTLGETISGPYLADAPNFHLEADVANAYQLSNPSNQRPLTDFSSEQALVAAAGLGNPKKFFDVLKAQGLSIQSLPLPDHYDFQENPFKNISASAILITEKDAVKCSQIAEYQSDERIWVVPVNVRLPKDFVTLMTDILHRPQP